MAEDGHKVVLNVYDLSQGLARQFSMPFLGKDIEAIWHTGVVVYGNEYYFSGGIQQDPAGRTPYGSPFRTVELGVTHIPKEVFDDYLQEISPRYTAETYNLLRHNCNHFSNEIAQFLVGATIPDYILQLPNQVMNSPMGALMLPIIQQLETTLGSGAVPRPPQFTPSAATVQPSLTRSTAATDDRLVPVKQDDNQSVEYQKSSANKKVQGTGDTILPALKPAAVKEDKKSPVLRDSLGDARSKVQEEITTEFAAIMATGTLRASEAAALATRRVMERHGRVNATLQQG